MPTFEVDDQFAFHRKTLRAGNEAIGVWVRAGAWATGYLTDGLIPFDVAYALSGETCPPMCPPGSPPGTPQGTPTGRPPLCPRPVPPSPAPAPAQSLPIGSDILEASNPKPGRKAKAETTMPDGWQPSEAHSALATEMGVDMAREAAKFADHHQAKGSVFRDWDAAFRTWLRNAGDWARKSSSQSRPRTAYPVQSGAGGLEYLERLRAKQRDAKNNPIVIPECVDEF